MRRLALIVLLLGALAVHGSAAAQERWDVIVVGSEPEAIAAAVTAAEEGARTVLVNPHATLGGLFVRGALNVLDVRTDPFSYQQGIFGRWWARVGGGHAFDVERAQSVFERMLAESGVEVIVGEAAPVLEAGAGGGRPRVTGVRVPGRTLTGGQVVDGTADADLAAAAGAPSTIGFAMLGYPERMADTLVFRIDGIDWGELTRSVRARGKSYASIDDRVAWGSFGGVPAAYEPSDPTLRLRGLNLGRETDGSVWVNALLIYGLDPFDPESLAGGRARAAAEAPRVVEYLRGRIPGFERATYAGAAEALYVRETRHLDASCMLTADDVLDNRVTGSAIAAGGYPLDVQTLTPNDSGFVFGVPDVYGVELCVTIPKGIDGLWVVGRSAGYDPIAHSSARVVPLGMAVGEAVGVAAALASLEGLTPAEFAAEPQRVGALREHLSERGAYLPVPRARAPVGPWQHPHYEAYRTMLSRGLAVGGYENEPRLDEEVGALGYIYLLANVGQRFLQRNDLGRTLLASHGSVSGPLASDLAAEITAAAGCALGRCPDAVAWPELAAAGLAPAGFSPTGDVLSRGEIYALASRLVETFGRTPAEPSE